MARAEVGSEEFGDGAAESGSRGSLLGGEDPEGLWWKTFKRLWTAKMSATSLSAASRPRLMKRRKPRFSLVSPKTGSTMCERVA
jgi:hypothetical protein